MKNALRNVAHFDSSFLILPAVEAVDQSGFVIYQSPLDFGE